jgi:hypothetical protein
MEIISQREFSRRVDVSEGTIRKAIEAGWIINGCTTRASGLPAINYEIALEEWEKSPGGLQAAEKRTLKGEIRKKTPVPDVTKSTAPADAPPSPKLPIYDAEAAEIKKNIIKEKSITAKIQQQKQALELQKILGKLVDKDKVEGELFNFGKGIRENLTRVPDRYIDEIRNAPDRHTAYQILLNGINEALRSLSSPPDLSTAY